MCPESQAILRGGRGPRGESNGSSAKKGLEKRSHHKNSLQGLGLRFPTCAMGITTLTAGSSVRTPEEGL